MRPRGLVLVGDRHVRGVRRRAVLLMVSIVKGWPVLPLVFGAVLIGFMVTTAARRQQTEGRTGKVGERPWKNGAE
ncbi:hypothetical protein ABZ923_19525 [Streptomyces sp. NPDC046881]|uniref:hypothetical protein n=1 Tax=Streptomyces sp. NPDC046881 TaxID=3155374 RepID=UPI0033C0342B